jgi:predicted dehydrogenase
MNGRRPFKILLVGAGQIGSRHLQGLARATLSLSIEILEPHAAAREIAIQRFHEIPASEGAKELHGIDRLDASAFEGHADLAIIATTAAARYDAIQDVLNRLTIPFLVLEKVLFQRIADLDTIERVLAEKSCTAWVNCSRRLLPHNRQLRDIFLGDEVKIHAQGDNWGLACNGIHLLDLLAFLSGSSHSDGWNIEALDASSYPSKRESYLEFGGAVGFRLKGGHEIVIWDGRSVGGAPLVIEIAGPHARAIVNESAASMTLSRRADGWKTERCGIHVPRQSDLTNLIAEDILIRGTCGLTEYRESAELHRAYLGAFLEHVGTLTGVDQDVCPIT